MRLKKQEFQKGELEMYIVYTNKQFKISASTYCAFFLRSRISIIRALSLYCKIF